VDDGDVGGSGAFDMAVGEQALAQLVRVDVRDLAAQEPDGEGRHAANATRVRPRPRPATARARRAAAARAGARAGGTGLGAAASPRSAPPRRSERAAPRARPAASRDSRAWRHSV